MKFIFPQNYKFNTKLLGLLDYPTAILNCIWFAIIFIITKLLMLDLLTKIIVFIITCFPVLLISLFRISPRKYCLRFSLYFYFL